jgi:acylpyruvate hydrolase
MRLISFVRDGRAALGVVEEGTVVDLGQAAPDLPQDMLAFIGQGADALERAESASRSAPRAAILDLAEVDFLPLVPAPRKILCLGLNYAEHAAEGGYQRPRWPTIFLRCARSLTAHNAPIVRPVVSEQLDYEAELAVVIGRDLRHATEQQSLDGVYGYACFNDASVRDYQRKTIQWTMGKNFESTGAFGPALVTADELPQGAVGLDIACRLNGQTVQQANTSQMIFSVAETLSLLSDCVTLEPGDVVVMGTPSGVGHARKPPLWMRHGDQVEVEIEGIGVLRNTIQDERVAAEPAVAS